MKPIEFNAFAIALKAAIESKDEFNKTTFRKICYKFITHSETERFFDALLKRKYIINTKGLNYAFVIRPGIMSRNELINLFDQFRIRKPKKYSPEGREKLSNAMKVRWSNMRSDITSFSIDELKAEILRREKEQKKQQLSSILASAGMSVGDLLKLIEEVG